MYSIIYDNPYILSKSVLKANATRGIKLTMTNCRLLCRYVK